MRRTLAATVFWTAGLLGPLVCWGDTITGTLPDGGHAIFQIQITDPSTFSATTVGTVTSFDTQLFLFDAAGIGILANDDADFFTPQSTLPAGDPRLTSLAPGLYLLAVSVFNASPVDAAANSIFLPGAPTDLRGPNPLAGPLDGFTTSRTFGGDFEILLTGVAPATTPIPEPASLASWALLAGVCGLGAWICRRTPEAAFCGAKHGPYRSAEAGRR